MIWKGVYSDIKEIPSYKHLDTDAWVQSQVKKLKATIEDPKKIKNENLLLKVLLATAPDAVVVDYGGSLALSYVALGCPKDIDYHVVETPAICAVARELNLPELEKVKFHDHHNKIDFPYEVLYTRTALQYASDWKDVLAKLLKGRPTMVSLAHTSCGNIPTYLTTQDWYGTPIPYWFINQDELCGLMKDNGYTLISDKRCEIIENLFFDENGNHDIPLSHILTYTKDLVFSI